MKQTIPVFYACDDSFVKYTIVSLSSMIKNASSGYDYRVYILHTEISEDMKKRTLELENEDFHISFINVSDRLEKISEKLPIRDYYSKTTYYRFFISEMFPEYKKVIYIDSDTIVAGDISELYNIDIGDAYVGACHEQAMIQVEEYGRYVERVMGISRYNFFNAGMMLINSQKFRERKVLDKFIDLLHTYTFVVTQDEDYLNLICKDRVFWLEDKWNTEIYGEIPCPIEKAGVIHYIMTSKPWHYSDCRHGDIFWKYAKDTSVYNEIKTVLDTYTDEQREADARACDALLQLAIKETEREDNYLNILNKNVRSSDRVKVLERIETLEKSGVFDRDVEDDPPSRMLMPGEIDYLKKSPVDKIKSTVAYRMARRFVCRLIDEKKLVVKEIKGIENFNLLESGAVVTCNHFNAYDSFIMQLVYEASNKKDKIFYRVIREGNYTSFKGFYGFLMRNCNTLPLSTNHKTLRKFKESTDKILCRGDIVLIYPEQSMWWNYRKPKPLKKGAYMFAAKNNVPVLPCFITMKDTDMFGDDGFCIQEHTVHIGKPIYPDNSLKYSEKIKKMMDENFMVWKEIYEREYSMPLIYTTEIK